tara:strand:- start:126 stop:356 length:231 start_codon:yes stop_codon:yes gene_type:complete
MTTEYHEPSPDPLETQRDQTLLRLVELREKAEKAKNEFVLSELNKLNTYGQKMREEQHLSFLNATIDWLELNLDFQ